MKKRLLSILTALALLLSLLPVTALPAFAAGESYHVAGVAELCGSLWDANDDNNLMALNADTGLYEKTYTDVQPGEYPIKVVETCADGTTNWYGDARNEVFVIYVSAACNVTVTFDAGTHAIGILGDSAQEKTWMDIDAIRVVGNGNGVWLNGVSWDPAADVNKMTEVSPGVYEITYAQVPAGSGYLFKFAANGSWTDNWGAGSTEGEAVFNSDDSISLVLTETTDVTLRLDLTSFVFATKQGATYAVVLGSGDDTEKVEADYLDAEGNLQTCAAASVLTADSTAWEAGWYVAQGEVTIPEAVTLNGDVHLILADNCGLTVERGITGSGNLTVYAQSTGDQMGSLTATGTAVSEKDAVSAGISAGAITVNGGTINATGGTGEGSDITSAGLYSTPGDITINGGSVTATGGTVTGACGTSSGIATEEADITVNGGTVNATGAPSATWSIGIYAYWGAFLLSNGSVTATGMDAEYDGGRTSAWSIGLYSDEFTVSGGELTATAGTAAGNMPQSYGITCAFARIDGGTVIAEAGAVDGGESIGISNYGTFTVTGGQVIATSGAAAFSLGIRSIGDEQRFSVSGDAAVEATSGESTNLSAGVYAYSGEGGGTISISGHASLLAIGKHSEDTSYGIYAEFPYADETSKVSAVQVTGGDLNVICFGGNELSYGVYAATILGDEAPQMTGELYISDGHVRVHNTDEGGQNHSALSAQPDLSGYGRYMWRTGMEDGFTPSTTPYEYSPTHSFVEFGGVASYGVSVNGVDVNEVNYADVLSDGVNDGKVSYDPATNTLTVTGALKDAEDNSILLEIAGNDTTDVVLSAESSTISAGLTAFAVKDVTATAKSDNPAFTGAVDITCSGNVALANSGTGIMVAGTLTVNGAKDVTVTAAGSGQVIMGTTVISCSGDVSIVNSGTGMAVTAPLTVTGAKDVTVTANGGPTIAAAANIDCSGNVTIANSGGNITVTGTLTVTDAQDVTVTANAKNPAIAATANIDCSGNVKIANEGAGNAVSGKLTVTAAQDVTVSAKYYGPTVPSAVEITCSGNVTLTNESTGMFTGSTLTVHDAKNVTVTTNSGSPAIPGEYGAGFAAKINCSGNVKITNNGGMALGGTLIVTGAQDVTVTANANNPAIAGVTDITCSGNVTLTNEGTGMVVPGPLTVTGAKDVTVTANSGSPACGSPTNINCSGNVKITNNGGMAFGSTLTVTGAKDVTVTANTTNPAISSVTTITCSGEVEIVNLGGGRALASTLEIRKTDAHGYVVKTGADADNLTVYAEKAAGETFGPETLDASAVKTEVVHSLTKTEAKEPTCTEAGNSEYWTCSVCGKYFSDKDGKTEIAKDSWIIEATGHSLTKTEAKEPTCTEAGNSEYWTCSVCHKYFSDANGKNEIAKDSWVIEATGHTLTKTEAKAPTCTEAGNSEYWTCSVCDKYFSDEEGKTEIAKDSWVIDATGHSLTKTEAKAPTCTEAGNSEYWTCSVCHKFFSDEEGKNEIAKDSWIIDATGHTLTKTEAKAPTCTEAGNSEYWTCSVCGKYFSDKDGKNEIAKDSWVIEATGHSLTKTEAKEPTCTEAGNSEYWTCSVCGKYFSDEEGKTEIAKDSWVIKATGHSLTKTEATKPTCTEAGNSEYWTCSVCHKYFSDANGKNEIAKDSWVIKATGHTLTKTEAKEPTCTEAGNSEYWTCSVCGKFFSDEEGKNEIEKDSWVIDATGHSLTKTEATKPTCTEEGNSEYWTCTVCGKYFSDEAGTTEIEKDSWKIKATGHTLDNVAEVPATCIKDGVKAHRHCKICGKNFVDGVEKTDAELKIPATGHTPGEWEHDSTQHWRFCTVCKTELDRADHTFSGDSCTVCGYTKPSTGGSYTPIVADTENGTVTVSPMDPTQGAQVTITPEPEEGYEVGQVIVTDKDGSPVEVTDNGDGTYSFTQPAGSVTIQVTFCEETVVPFEDVSAKAYYYDAVKWAVKHGITNGTSETTFSPNDPCTRAQVVTFLWRSAGCPAPKSTEMPFKDVVKGSYYETAVLWAAENDITNGTSSTTFSPDDTCSRAQIATFLWRSQGMPDAGTTNPFTDVTSGKYYYNAVLWAVENGITNGTSATTFSPDEDCTRAQIVTFLYRCLSK